MHSLPDGKIISYSNNTYIGFNNLVQWIAGIDAPIIGKVTAESTTRISMPRTISAIVMFSLTDNTDASTQNPAVLVWGTSHVRYRFQWGNSTPQLITTQRDLNTSRWRDIFNMSSAYFPVDILYIAV